MDDLVERLREVQGNVTKSYRNPEGPEAADEIERLRRRNALLEDVAAAAEKMADFIVDYDGCDGGAWREFWDALDKLREVGDE